MLATSPNLKTKIDVLSKFNSLEEALLYHIDIKAVKTIASGLRNELLTLPKSNERDLAINNMDWILGFQSYQYFDLPPAKKKSTWQKIRDGIVWTAGFIATMQAIGIFAK